MKQKTHSGTKKRTRVTGSGKVVMQKSCKRHLLSSKNKRALKSETLGKLVPKGHMKMISRLLNISK